MKTDKKTGGFMGGFTDARTVRPRCRATAVLPRDCGSRYRVVAAKKDARPVLQHRTGASNGAYQLTEDSIARMPRWQRWGLYALAALTMSGIIRRLRATRFSGYAKAWAGGFSFRSTSWLGALSGA